MFLRNAIFACVIVVQIISCAYSQYRFGCDADFCSKKVGPCPALNCKEGSRIIKNATTCGCCHICVDAIKECVECKTREIGSIPRRECGPGLMCDQKKSECVPAQTKCLEDQRRFDVELSGKDLELGIQRPKCDAFGFYEPVVCISDVLCYCVDKNGTRIFGTDIATKKDSMHCNCSRGFQEFPKNVPDGNFLRCLPNGNYDLLQCTDDWCFCMQGNGKVIGHVVKANDSLEDLICYDINRHKGDDALLRSKCWRERDALKQKIEQFQNDGISVIGVDLPKCELDGSYAPVQCKKDSCFCVKRNGQPYDKFKVKRNSKEAYDMNCRCVREKEILSDLEDKNENMLFFETFKCAANGNYEIKQCVGSKCFDVSNMGYQINTEELQMQSDCD